MTPATLWSFDGESILRHSEAGAISHHIRTARALLDNLEGQGWSREQSRQLREAIAAYDAAQPPQLTEQDIEAALAERALEHAQ